MNDETMEDLVDLELDLPMETINQLDEIASKEGKTREQLIVELLTKMVELEGSFVPGAKAEN